MSLDPPMNPSSSSSSSRISLAALCTPTPDQAAMTDVQSSASSSASKENVTVDTMNRLQKPLSLSEEDESVMIAVSALGDMRSRPAPSSSNSSSYTYSTSPQQTPTLTRASMSTSPSNSSLKLSPEEGVSTDFVSRVSGLPIVTTALRAYEHSKASSRVVKYGAEMMESSVKSISKPVIDRLPVNQLDQFACRQLDRLGRYGKPDTSPDAEDSRTCVERGMLNQSWERHTRDEGEAGQTSRESSRSPDQSEVKPEDRPEGDGSREIQQDANNRSRWHTLFYEAGGLGVAVSDESMRRLKYCLHWLQYATDHIDGQILILRNFIGSLNAQDGGMAGIEERHISASHMQTLTAVKRDVVGTIRQVVDVVSKYAGGALPEPARTRVRQFILHLPQQWANTAHRQAHNAVPAHNGGQSKGPNKRRRRDNVGDTGSAASTAPSSPFQSPRVNANLSLPAIPSGSTHRPVSSMRPTAVSATAAAQRILTLATESLDMMRNVTGVFKESLDRAEVWVERLRMVGIQRQTHSENEPEVGPSQAQEGTHEPDASVSTASTFTSFPPSPRTWPLDAPSPGAIAVSSIDALTLSSAFATPRSNSATSLPSLAGYDWEYTASKLQAIKDESIVRAVERSPISALRGTALETGTMEVDER